ncbi:Predicted phosphodiesterase [Candidatus Kryptonium thompsonii]|uniref:Predicted phosphodiesterase n=1 Tax=Candidatus Kryptonium thompsonii TaxID=1633631 RepID=A0A0P1MID3_9BACT|nr:metallophosphoesterase family protein [Candidatus Kryptonium thompsoni]CUS78100.1 Predicted phosphodiesterase [Candidatus Kryptonium thompsoni]CUS82865.1 Predicted phosphodiesterase [Candidatus Kryptonium thompsoni]CUS86100.1 Predicted phosphodiesterase [Candidatus Kryptonium thompsoni]CUS87787.1 Predicted phosphodiesterase [Candidatus Kryptonium thompsoni]CUS88917.1 Predicted phosphodiesterase [Candidatus Kryptonium thompsoni]
MRIAIISDIHSNLEALTKAFEIIDTKNVDEIVCLGDIVGYGANPNECVELIKKRVKYVVIGNHDYAVAVDPNELLYFSAHARESDLWTRDVLTKENLDFLKSLPFTISFKDLLFVHSSPAQPREWEYIFTEVQAKVQFPYFKEKICFIGHSHLPGVFPETGSYNGKLDRNTRYIINVGSVGQPRDGDWRLCFGIFDTNTWTYEEIRAEYDVEKASNKIIQNGLPKVLAKRILVGW